MALVITNSLTGKKELFVPQQEGIVRMYVCGPTTYNFIHIGNARPLVFFDVVRRTLEYLGYNVQHVINFTDLDDKIIDRAKKENTSSTLISEKYIAEYRTDMALLKVKQPTEMPKVSEHLPEIIQLIESLIKVGIAYVKDGEVFYSVRKFSNYGKLSGKNLDDLQLGVRVEISLKKRDPLDFTLWKPQKEPSEPAWQSPWGMGRPGWHIECSAMAMKYLGSTLDIHGGGMDLMHPHHENEIAQSEAVTKKPFVNYWLHNNMVNVNSEKMSKSIGNILLTREFIDRYTAETLKFMLLSGHYRSVIDFSEQHLKDSQSALHRIYSTILKCENFVVQKPLFTQKKISPEEEKANEMAKIFKDKWIEALCDDFNTAKCIGYVFEYVRTVNSVIDKKGLTPTEDSLGVARDFLSHIMQISRVINLFAETASSYLAEFRNLLVSQRGLKKSEIEDLIQQRAIARKTKDFHKADLIRKQLDAMGVELRDVADSTEWDLVLTK